MFKHYKDMSDVVSLLVFCPCDKSYLLTKEANGEYWIPSSKVDKNNNWKLTAHKLNVEMFGVDAGALCSPMRVHKVWLPNHPLSVVYHVVYKVAIKADLRKRGIRNRLQWFSSVELDRHRVHSMLRSPEVAFFAMIAIGEKNKDIEELEIEAGTLVEICEDNVILGGDVAGGAAVLTSSNLQLIQAAGFSKESQIRVYREFILMVFPALYMSPHVFTQFMMDVGWQRPLCTALFRAADVTSRGGLSFVELLVWSAALEPATPHSGVAAEIRCRYIFRYFDSNRDQKLEYQEFKELVAAARSARQLTVDSLSVARDADVCLRQIGLEPNSQLPLSDFLRGVGELRLRGTSSLLRAPRSLITYLIDLQATDRELVNVTKSEASTSKVSPSPALQSREFQRAVPCSALSRASGGASASRRVQPMPDYNMAMCTVRFRRSAPTEMLELHHFEEDAVSPSSARLLVLATSLEVLGPSAAPVEALAAVHYFAAPAMMTTGKRLSLHGAGKPAWSWSHPGEELALGALLLRLAVAVRPLCEEEPRLLRVTSPVYAIGDLHGNLPALLTMESVLWPSGTALAPARILFLGDYVDRGAHGTELLAYLFAAKVQRPQAVFMIRGNHETRDIQKMFTFYNECIGKYGETEGVKIWNAVNNVFDVMPLAAVVDDKVFCCHGGIPPPWVCPVMSAIDKVPVPLPRPAEQSSIAWELLWNDPVKPHKMTATLAMELAANEGFAANVKRGTGHVFDQTALDRFLVSNQLSHVVRAHELHQNGFMCQLRGRLVSVFSSYHYCGGTNDSGVALLEGGKLRLLRVNLD